MNIQLRNVIAGFFCLVVGACAENPFDYSVGGEGAGEASPEPMSVERAVVAGRPSVIVRIKAQGASASASYSDALGDLGMEVSEVNSSATGTQAVLSFARNWRDASSRVCRREEVCEPPKGNDNPVCTEEEVCGETRHSWENFFGEIPVGSFVRNGKVARLTVDLSKANVRSYERCDADESAGTVECSTQGPSGTFALKWKVDGELTVTETGTKEERRPHSLKRTRGTSVKESAVVSGTGLGNVFGGVGEVVQVTGAALEKEWTITR